jgi:hypothetical protein
MIFVEVPDLQLAEEVAWHSHSWLCTACKCRESDATCNTSHVPFDFFRNLFSQGGAALSSAAKYARPLCRGGLSPVPFPSAGEIMECGGLPPLFFAFVENLGST